MVKTSALLFALVIAGYPSPAVGQSPRAEKATPTSTFISSEALDKVLAQLKGRPEPVIDQPLRVVDAGSGYNVGIAVIRRTKPEAQSLLHDKITEVYHVLEGGGTLTTGGTLVDRKPPDAALLKLVGPGGVGTAIQGGRTQRLKAGDIVIIPSGTPNMFTQLEGTITYIIVRVDTGKVLALQ